ncbi:hypothetical protein Hanom_Chr03g00271311 [Helianthus anomalus]
MSRTIVLRAETSVFHFGLEISRQTHGASRVLYPSSTPQKRISHRTLIYP